ncbi:WD repeat and coiled-coil-containing protein-like [Lissotriton helveticus]
MELGKAKLLRTGLNALYHAMHPAHGLAWTDGRQVVLTAVHLHNREPKFGASSVIGQFEHVHGLSWGPVWSPDIPALLAVQHKKHVTVWQLFTIPLERNKLLLSQTCELGEPFPVLPQGCVWHPQKDMLVVLTKQEASLLHSVRSDNSSIRVDIKSDGFIHCACWTKDGNRMVVAAGTAIHSYIWDDDQKTLNVCTFCPLFDVGGYICAIESTLDSQVAVATEIPLEKASELNAGVAFDVPNSAKSASLNSQASLLYLGERLSRDLRRKSIDSEQSIATDSVLSSLSAPVDLAHILANHRRSDPSPLIHLKRQDNLRKSRDSSYLVLVTFENKVTTTRKVHISSILMPDIVTFDPRAQLAAVASNTSNVILVYTLTSSNVPNIQQIHLEKNERTKGVCFLTDDRLLVLVGKQKFNEPAFFPSSSSDKYIVRLVVKELMHQDDSSTISDACKNLLIDFDPGANLAGKGVPLEIASREEGPVSREHLIPNCTISKSPSGRRRLVDLAACRSASCEQSTTSSASDYDDMKISTDSSMVVETLDAEPVNRLLALINTGTVSRGCSRSSSLKMPSRNKNMSDEGESHISGNLERLRGGFIQLEQRLSELKGSPKNGKKFMSAYPSALEPPCVFITFQKPVSEGAVTEDTRAVLLCDGKLQLSTIQELFRLPVIEIKHGSSWIVLTADSDGYIPLTFRSAQEIIIRDASASLRAYDSCSSNVSEAASSTESTNSAAQEANSE